MDLPTFWFWVIATFWLGYLFLEGFDFGVGMTLGILGCNNTDRRVLINTIGPVWDGNEVWLIVAVGATFAAFPDWYAGLLSTLYLLVLVIVLALIVRGVAFEYRGKVDSATWRRAWDRAIIVGSLIAPLGVGALLVTNVFGLPIDAAGNRVGGPLAPLGWPALLGALAFAGFAFVHGTVFLSLKTSGEIRARARGLALRSAPLALLPLAVLLVLLVLRGHGLAVLIAACVAVLAGVLGLARLAAHRDGQAFGAFAVLVAATVVTLFASLYPAVIPSTVDPAFSISVRAGASGHYTLVVMSWLAAFGAPAVLAYQGWTYWVFRHRLARSHIPAPTAPTSST
ncbi:MAG: cytochrome d ubiquinol oxidase subunit II [Sciscionella sp.]